MPNVERDDGLGLVAFYLGHHDRIDEAESQVAIALEQSGRAREILRSVRVEAKQTVADVLRDAFSAAPADPTDCASLVEAKGGRVRAVDGDPRLVKITTPADLERVESWL